MKNGTIHIDGSSEELVLEGLTDEQALLVSRNIGSLMFLTDCVRGLPPAWLQGARGFLKLGRTFRLQVFGPECNIPARYIEEREAKREMIRRYFEEYNQTEMACEGDGVRVDGSWYD